MERREFLQAGTGVLVGASVLQEACATPALAAEPKLPALDPEAVEGLIRRLDARLAKVETDTSGEGVLKDLQPLAHDDSPMAVARQRLLRDTIRSFYLAGVFLELEEHERLHPGVQERIRRMQPEFTSTMLRMTDLLENMDPAERRGLQQMLQKEPDLGSRVGELITDAAKEDGFSFARRVDLRLAFNDLAGRLRAQNPSLLIDTVVSKARRLEARPPTEADLERQYVAKLGEQAFWDLRRRSDLLVKEWDRIYETRPRHYLANLEATYRHAGSGDGAPDPTAAPTRLAHLGGYMLGVGGFTTAIGLIFLNAASNSSGAAEAIGLVMGVTVGPILLGLGLLVLIVAGLWYLSAAP